MANRGTGAGGANTNASGLPFEEKTASQHRLQEQGYAMVAMQGGKFSYYMEKDGVVFMTKGGLKTYMKEKFGVEIFREPDEAYLIKRPARYVLKIIEKKNQNTDGSVDTKLLAGPGFLAEYAWSLKDATTRIDVEYAFCVSNFLKEKVTSEKPKWQALRDINKKYGIAVLFGDDEDYFEKLDEWLQS
jgi:hypothetical protein